MYSFQPGDSFVKEVDIPADYMPRITAKLTTGLVRHFRSQREDTSNFDLWVSSHGWAVNTRDHRCQKLLPVLRRVQEVINEDEAYAGTFIVPLHGRANRIASILFAGNTEFHTPNDIERIRIESTQAVNPFAHSFAEFEF